MRNVVVYHSQFLTDDPVEEIIFNAKPIELISPKVRNFKNKDISFKNDQKIGDCFHYLFLSLVYRRFEKKVK